MQIELRPIQREDLSVLFEIQCDPVACALAAVNPRSRSDFDAHWQQVLIDPAVCGRAILAAGEIIGSISCFVCGEDVSVGYWLKRTHWGRGIATQALEQILKEDGRRPLHARVAQHNTASVRVLQKCGFQIVGTEFSTATERYQECVEVLLQLDGPAD